MSDFLHNLRTGNIKRYDRPRKSYDNPQYRHPQDRQYNKDRKSNYHKKLNAGELLLEIKKHLEGISQNIDDNLKTQERAASALERIEAVLESTTGIKPAVPAAAEISADRTTEPSDVLPEKVPADPEPASAEKADLLATITALRAGGASYEKIAGELENRGIPTLSGRGKWRGPAISKLLKENNA